MELSTKQLKGLLAALASTYENIEKVIVSRLEWIGRDSGEAAKVNQETLNLVAESKDLTNKYRKGNSQGSINIGAMSKGDVSKVLKLADELKASYREATETFENSERGSIMPRSGLATVTINGVEHDFSANALEQDIDKSFKSISQQTKFVGRQTDNASDSTLTEATTTMDDEPAGDLRVGHNNGLGSLDPSEERFTNIAVNKSREILNNPSNAGVTGAQQQNPTNDPPPLALDKERATTGVGVDDPGYVASQSAVEANYAEQDSLAKQAAAKQGLIASNEGGVVHSLRNKMGGPKSAKEEAIVSAISEWNENNSSMPIEVEFYTRTNGERRVVYINEREEYIDNSINSPAPLFIDTQSQAGVRLSGDGRSVMGSPESGLYESIKRATQDFAYNQKNDQKVVNNDPSNTGVAGAQQQSSTNDTPLTSFESNNGKPLRKRTGGGKYGRATDPITKLDEENTEPAVVDKERAMTGVSSEDTNYVASEAAVAKNTRKKGLVAINQGGVVHNAQYNAAGIDTTPNNPEEELMFKTIEKYNKRSASNLNPGFALDENGERKLIFLTPDSKQIVVNPGVNIGSLSRNGSNDSWQVARGKLMTEIGIDRANAMNGGELADLEIQNQSELSDFERTGQTGRGGSSEGSSSGGQNQPGPAPPTAEPKTFIRPPTDLQIGSGRGGKEIYKTPILGAGGSSPEKIVAGGVDLPAGSSGRARSVVKFPPAIPPTSADSRNVYKKQSGSSTNFGL